MPETQTLTVTRMQLKTNDVIVNASPIISGKTNFGQAVVDVKNGRTNTVVNLSQGRMVLPDGANVVVEREVPTAQEEQAKLQQRATIAWNEFSAEMHRLAEMDVRKYMLVKLDNYSDLAQGLGWYAEDIMEMQHRVNFAQTFIAINEHAETSVEALESWKAHLLKEMTYVARNPHSSTSGSANLSHQAKGTAAAKMLEDFKLASVEFYLRELAV